MKTTLIILSLCLFLSCNKTEINPYNASAEGLTNNKSWNSTRCIITPLLVCRPNKIIEVGIIHDTEFRGKQELISIWHMPPVIGTYSIKKETFLGDNCNDVTARAYWKYFDETLGQYSITNTPTNILTIAEIDTIDNYMRGSFNLTFTLDKTLYPSTPDTLHIRGHFRGQITLKL